jgi:hypothetical protein
MYIRIEVLSSMMSSATAAMAAMDRARAVMVSKADHDSLAVRVKVLEAICMGT